MFNACLNKNFETVYQQPNLVYLPPDSAGGSGNRSAMAMSLEELLGKKKSDSLEQFVG